MPGDAVVYVVDDDEALRDSVSALVQSLGLEARAFPSAEEFLRSFDPEQPGCLVTDVRMFGMSGVELQEKLVADGVPLPVIVLTAFAKTPLTVRVMQNGAVTLLEKPYDTGDLWDAIRRALALDFARRAAWQEQEDAQQRLALLTAKEREVLDRMIAGKANKVIARELDVSIRTVENRRHDIFEKVGVDSVAQLVRLAIVASAPRPEPRAPEAGTPELADDSLHGGEE